jgi:hypothetical protein
MDSEIEKIFSHGRMLEARPETCCAKICMQGPQIAIEIVAAYAYHVMARAIFCIKMRLNAVFVDPEPMAR